MAFDFGIATMPPLSSPPTNETTTKTTPETVTITDLEDTIRDLFTAINTRDYAPGYSAGHPVWRRFSEDFIAYPEYALPSFAAASTDWWGATTPKQLNGREKLKQNIREVVGSCPDYTIRISREINTTVDFKAKWACSFVHMETLGLAMSEGRLMESVGMFEWRFMGGKWMVVKYKGFAGMDGAG